MITKIISGGQTGADRGGLDAAIELDIEHGGWCPQGRLAEDGKVPLHYNLEEMSGGYPARTRANVVDADATVIFTVGPLTRGSRLTVLCCIEARKPYKHIDLEAGLDEAVAQFVEWLNTVRNVLNVAGSRESKAPGIQEMVKDVLVLALRKRA